MSFHIATKFVRCCMKYSPTSRRRRSLLPFFAAAITGVAVARDDIQLVDRGLSTVGQETSPWRQTIAPGGILESVAVDDFQGKVLHVRNASCAQTVTLSAGVYEVAAIAWGAGEISLAAEGLGERSLRLGPERATYGYLFESPNAAVKITVGIRGEGYVRAVAMRTATADQTAAWQRAQESVRQFGFATTSPQRPPPGDAGTAIPDRIAPLAAMTDCVVLDEPLMNTGHAVNEQRLVTWLTQNGFTPLTAEGLADWMRQHAENGTAYGSVVVLCRGITPANLLEGPKHEPLWLTYLRAGGRIVNAGGLPFYTYEYATVKPLMPDANERGMNLLGLDAGWHSAFWGNGNLPVAVSSAGRAWGFENVDTAVTGFPRDAVSLAFGTYVVAADGRAGATTWFKNLRVDAPWSGLVKIRQHFDGNDDAALRDVWRAAHYAGRPVSIPSLPPPPVALKDHLSLDFAAGGMAGRHQWVRGELIKATAKIPPGLAADGVRFEFWQDNVNLLRKTMPCPLGIASIDLDTSAWAIGGYEFSAIAVARGRAVAEVRHSVGIRHVQECHFPFMIWHQAGPNLLRTNLEFKDIYTSRMEPLLTRTAANDIDAAVSHGMGFAIRIDTDLKGANPPEFERQPDCFRLDPNGRPIATAYSGGRPSLGLSHELVRANAAESIREPISAVRENPAFRPFALCNDDYSIYYGWDYSPAVLAAYQEDTGRVAPRDRPQTPPPGQVPDDDPWIQWFRWTLLRVNGGFNSVETAAATSASPAVRLGPIPGAMQIPFVSLTEPAQYPPYNFGANGFNLIASYYYNTFWQPVMTTSFWMEVGRMGNRMLPQWNMPDALGTVGYTRNNFYHYLLGGVDGLAYYRYGLRSSGAWNELGRLGRVMRRIGPLQAALEPAARDVALLNSFTTGCFDPGHTLNQTFAYHNLMQAHYDVSVVAEEEIDAAHVRAHRAIVLNNVRWLRASAVAALARHAASGGLVILDATVPFDIPAAHRVAIDLATGREPEGGRDRFESAPRPGINDYGDARRIARIAALLEAILPKRMHCDDIRLVAARFTANAVPCTWYVNVHDGREYLFCRERAGAGHPGSRTPDKIAALAEWEQREMEAGPYEAIVRVPAETGVPYDVVAMTRVPTKPTANGVELTLKMDRFGGALVAWLPCAITEVRLSLPAAGTPLEPMRFTATCIGASAKPDTSELSPPGIVPFEVVLLDPENRKHPWSGVHAMSEGKIAIDWTPARNDLRGTWSVAVRELFGGTRASGTFTLAP